MTDDINEELRMKNEELPSAGSQLQLRTLLRRALKHKRESMTNRISEKDVTTSVISTGLKSLRMNLFSCEEKRQCDAAKHGAECLSIGNHSPKRKRTIGGLDDWRHSRHKWKPGQDIIIWVVTVGMVANALLCDQGRSYVFLPEVEFTPYTRFRVNVSMEG